MPTDLERTGDFSQSVLSSPGGIFDPQRQCDSSGCADRQQFSDGGVLNKIPASRIDPIGQKILDLYPQANVTDAVYPDPNYRTVVLTSSSSWQFDAKVDHQISANHKIGGRYSRHHDMSTAPNVIGSGDFGDGSIYTTNVQNGGLEYDWAITPTKLWTNRFSVDRVVAPGQTNNYPTLDDVGLPAILAANGLTRVPSINVDSGFPVDLHPVLRGYPFRALPVQLLFCFAMGEGRPFPEVRGRTAAFLQQLLATELSHWHL